MSLNYDGSQVGVPYVRAQRITLNYPDSGKAPTATIEQSLAVKLADGTIRHLDNIPQIDMTLDFAHGDDSVPLVNPEDASPLGMDTSLNQAFLAVLALVRKAQRDHNAD